MCFRILARAHAVLVPVVVTGRDDGIGGGGACGADVGRGVEWRVTQAVSAVL